MDYEGLFLVLENEFRKQGYSGHAAISMAYVLVEQAALCFANQIKAEAHHGQVLCHTV